MFKGKENDIFKKNMTQQELYQSWKNGTTDPWPPKPEETRTIISNYRGFDIVERKTPYEEATHQTAPEDKWIWQFNYRYFAELNGSTEPLDDGTMSTLEQYILEEVSSQSSEEFVREVIDDAYDDYYEDNPDGFDDLSDQEKVETYRDGSYVLVEGEWVDSQYAYKDFVGAVAASDFLTAINVSQATLTRFIEINYQAEGSDPEHYYGKTEQKTEGGTTYYKYTTKYWLEPDDYWDNPSKYTQLTKQDGYRLN